MPGFLLGALFGTGVLVGALGGALFVAIAISITCRRPASFQAPMKARFSLKSAQRLPNGEGEFTNVSSSGSQLAMAPGACGSNPKLSIAIKISSLASSFIVIDDPGIAARRFLIKLLCAASAVSRS